MMGSGQGPSGGVNRKLTSAKLLQVAAWRIQSYQVYQRTDPNKQWQETLT